MTGPSLASDPRCLPVRGDLAHIKLAGRCFVPHYAVPVAYAAKAGAVLVAAPGHQADVLAELAEGAIFNVLDIAGEWSWGQVGEDGLVGYVQMGQIEAPAAGTNG